MENNNNFPIYKRLINAIERFLEKRNLENYADLPSINELSKFAGTTRSSAERAYVDLKNRGVLYAVAGKGYYVVNAECTNKLKILVLINNLNAHRRILFDAIEENLYGKAVLDIHVYHNDLKYFTEIIVQRQSYYDKFIIIPYFNTSPEDGQNFLDALPKHKVVLMDFLPDTVGADIPAIYQDFEKDIHCALIELWPRIQKYHTLNLILPYHFGFYKNILLGFLRFCHQKDFNHEVVSKTAEGLLISGTVYIILSENDLFQFLERVESEKLKIGEDIGVISYHEIPAKKFMLDGITTISTDFHRMGIEIASVITRNLLKQIPVPAKVIIRNSL